MKLVIQIPSYNEAESIGYTLQCLPREVQGFDSVEYLVVDDGSDDGTAKAAVSAGAHYVVRHARNRGLAMSFQTGLSCALAVGADVVVNTDADNQYEASCIEALTRPILTGTAEIVIGNRSVSTLSHFRWHKKRLQTVGSWVVRLVSGTRVTDATCGFRAISKTVASRIHVFSGFTYTIETIIQVGTQGVPLAVVPIRANPPLRPSRLFRSEAEYIARCSFDIVRIFIVYRPLAFFGWFACAMFAPGIALGGRFVFAYLHGLGAGKIQSLILAAILIGIAGLLALAGVLADLVAVNRRLLEKMSGRISRPTSLEALVAGEPGLSIITSRS